MLSGAAFIRALVPFTWLHPHDLLTSPHKGPTSFFFSFPGPPLQHMEVPRLGVEAEPYLPAKVTDTATPDLSHICDLHCSLWLRSLTH